MDSQHSTLEINRIDPADGKSHALGMGIQNESQNKMAWIPSWFEIRTLALIEPTTSVILYPLIGDLFLRSSLAVTCYTSYVTLFFLLKICITMSSLILVRYSTEQIACLFKWSEREKTANFNKLYLIGVVWNAMFSYLMVTFGCNNRHFEEQSVDDCFPLQTDDSVVLAGLKSLVPQCLTLMIVVGVVVVSLLLNRYPAQLKHSQTDLESSSRLWTTVNPIAIAILFQLLYFGLRFGFVFCSCGWFKMESKLMNILNCTCLLKSIIIVFISLQCNHKANHPPSDSFSIITTSNGKSIQEKC